MTPDEQRLVNEYRTLSAAQKDDALAYMTGLARHAGVEEASGQCSLKHHAEHPAFKNEPEFTE